MKLQFISLIFLLFSQPALARQDESCTADVSQYTAEKLKTRVSLFTSKAKNVEKVFPSELMEYGFKDRIRLKNGVEVTYTTGGCAHYGYRFRFVGKSIKALKEFEKFDRATQLLKDLDLTDDDHRAQLIKALSDAKNKKAREMTPGYYPLPCGDANCELVDRGQQEVEIGYDFGL